MAKKNRVAIDQGISEFFRKAEREASADFAKIFKRIQSVNTPGGEQWSPVPGFEHDMLGTLPIAGGYEILFCCPDKEKGTYFALYAGKPNKVRQWLQIHVVKIDPVTKAVQVYQALTPEEKQPKAKKKTRKAKSKSKVTHVAATCGAPSGVDVAVSSESDTPQASTEALESSEEEATPRLFAALSEDQLLHLGVPQECVAPLKAFTAREDFDAFRPHLTEGSFEALVWLLDGEPFESVFEAYGEENRDNRRSFLVIESDEAMQEVMDASLDQWRIFLHPKQANLVKRPEEMPSLVRGAAGTGKTVVAMHRAVHLALQPDWKSGDKILFTTYTKNLAADIRAQLNLLFTQSGHWNQRDRVEVVNLDAWVAGFLKRNRIGRRIAYPGSDAYTRCWDNAFTLVDPSLRLPDTFYQDEWTRVVLPNEVRTEQDYLRVSRKGRGTALSRRERKLIWPVFDEMRTQLSDAKLMTIEEACQIAVRILQTHKGMTEYRAVIVDETQDLDDDALKLLARLALPKGDETKEPHIFLVGDGRQRIYARNGSLSACGINVRGRRSERLRLTYRTTEEIRRAANAILAGESYDDMDEGRESDKGDLAIRNGRAPITYVAADAASECAWVAEQIKALRSSLAIDYRDICIVGRTNKIVGDCMEMLDRSYGIPGDRISRNATDDQTKEGVRFATMHRVKGLEFRVVFIVDAGVESPEGDWNTDDPVEQHRHALTERSLRYVAASRAKDVLFISAHGKAPEWMKAIAAMANGSSDLPRLDAALTETAPAEAPVAAVSQKPEAVLPLNQPQPDLPAETETKTTRAKRFTFSMVGIPVGATLTFDPTGINVKVVSDSEVEYAGKRYKLSGFTKRFMPDSMRTISESYRGTLYFTYRGKTLQVWRDRLEAGLGLADEEP